MEILSKISEDGTMDLKVIKTDSEYSSALEDFGRLIDLDPAPGSMDADKLDLLALLVRDYESKKFPINLPDPVEAIEFVMDQKGMKQKDLVPFIGSRSKVSEILSRKRPLTLSMMRALHENFGIPAEVLLKTPGGSLNDDGVVDWKKFPLAEMARLGWIKGPIRGITDRAEEIVREFFDPIGGIKRSSVLFRKTHHLRAARNMNPYALEAWRAKVLHEAIGIKVSEFKKSQISAQFLTEIVRLSRADNGPLLAKDYLRSYGIVFVCVPHLSRTYIDGAAFFSPSGNPIVALTLRYDRLDNFWFTLLHELVHVWKHLGLDDMYIDDLDQSANNAAETEADNIAEETLIPKSEWEASEAFHFSSPDNAIDLAEKLRIHPAIVAGKIHHARRNYKILNHLVGRGEVRKLLL